MSTDQMYYPGQTLKLGLDGFVPFAPPLNDDCCAYSLCLDEVHAMCSFIDLLPTGPMWDGMKTKVRQQIIDAGGTPAEGFDCTSMVTYAAYLGRVLKDVVDSTIGVSIREQQAHTATNFDAFLSRLNWQDCYRTACRSNYLAKFSPYESPIDGCQETEYCPTAFPVAFENAMKHAIILALTRAQRGFIRNLDGFNWVIAPLGAQVVPGPYPADVQAYINGPAAAHPPCFCGEVIISLTSTGPTLPGAPTAESFCGEHPASVPAQQPYTDCDGNTVMLYPGLIAAECIVRSFLPSVCPNIIYRA